MFLLFSVATALAALVSAPFAIAVAIVAAVFFAWSVWFFRDPDRTTPNGPNLVISPADGKVIKIDEAPLPKEVRDDAPGSTTQPMVRIAIFLNLFNVHVNRVPASGTITRTSYVPGKFLNASLDKASEHNERSAAVMVDAAGRPIGFVQIAGLVARRIVNGLKVGQAVTSGNRFGLIRFGSRAEVYVPRGTAIAVKVGDHVIAGQSVLATLPLARASP